jgi:hypothetical protein
MFQANTQKTGRKTYNGDKTLPENFYSIPGLIKQSKIFFLRDFLSKLANRQYILISLLGAPLLAVLLAWFTKYTINGEYIFSDNENLPSYLFMCIITSLFLGLIISAEEIIKDRKILKRESFLNLSWFSYLNSKILILFLISAIQTLSFILIGNYILEIKDMTFSYWLVLFTTSCFANVLGLNISSAFTSVITIYILIPFILIPQLLFSGVIVKFDRLHKNTLSSYEYVPVIGDLMAARWSFEALAVNQFKNNRYERNFFRFNQGISQNDWYSGFLINDALKSDLKECKLLKDSIQFKERVENDFSKLKYYTGKLNGLAGFGPISGAWRSALNINDFQPGTAKETEKYLDSLSGHFRQVRKKFRDLKDSVSNSLEARYGRQGLMALKSNYYNKQLENIVLDRLRVEQYIETDKRIIQKYEPGYMTPTSKNGRAHFYAPYKQLGSVKIDTYWFNLIVLWIVTLGLYAALYYNILQKITDGLSKIKLKKAGR